jgi:hypothetical protein
MRTVGKFSVSESNKTKYRISVEIKQLLGRTGHWRSLLAFYLVVCVSMGRNGGTEELPTKKP